MKVLVRYPSEVEERSIYRLTSTGTPISPTPLVSGEEMLALQKIVHKVPVSDYCVNYVANLVRSTRAGDPKAPRFIKDWVQWGVGPRGGQSLIAAAQARAALDGRPEVDVSDIQAMVGRRAAAPNRAQLQRRSAGSNGGNRHSETRRGDSARPGRGAGP